MAMEVRIELGGEGRAEGRILSARTELEPPLMTRERAAGRVRGGLRRDVELDDRPFVARADRREGIGKIFFKDGRGAGVEPVAEAAADEEAWGLSGYEAHDIAEELAGEAGGSAHEESVGLAYAHVFEG
jgi:hypothetical protein